MSEAIHTDFDEWMVETFASTGPFTMLFVLVHIGDANIDILRSAYLHVIGDETRWPAMMDLFASAKVDWSAAAFFQADREGLVRDGEAQRRLAALVRKLHEDRLLIKNGEFFNREGLHLSLDVMKPH